MTPVSYRPPALLNLSLVRASLELGRDLADKDAVVFRSLGTCMYPTVRPGDLLVIRSRKAADVRIGEIAVCRRPDYLFGHRVIGNGLENGRPFIVTSPDRAEGGSDGPTFDENILGVVVEIRRKGRPVPLVKRSYPPPVRLWHAMRLALTGAAYAFRGRLIKSLAEMQNTAIYRRGAALWLARARRRMSFSVRVPFSPALGDSVFKEFPADLFDPNGSWLDKPIVRWTLAMRFKGDKIKEPAAVMAFIRGEEGAWQAKEFHVRSRYRGLKLEEELKNRAAIISAKKPG